LSAAFLVFVAGYSIPTFDWLTDVIGIGGIAIGVVPFLLNLRRREQMIARAALRPIEGSGG
jgi:hypothetical protein